MKHTTTRKKMLLSSVAMLLVAMMALGTATFAWFTSDPTADAKGLKMKTSSGTGLLVLSESEDAIEGQEFSHHTILRATKSGDNVVTNATAFDLKPASLSNSKIDTANLAAPGTFYTTTASSGSAYNRDESASATTITPSLTAPVYAEKIYTKVTGGVDSAAVKLTGLNWTTPDSTYAMCDTVRVAITDQSGNLVGIFANSADGNFYLTNTTSVSTEKYAPTAKSSSLDIKMGNASKSGESYFTVYVYVDGEDTECFSDQCSGADVLNALEINVELDT